MSRRLGITVLACLWLVAAAPRGQESPILSAMEDELRRSMAELRIEGEPAPYYIEYEVDDLVSMRAVARFGGIVDDLEDKGRSLRVQVRVGDYQFDNSRFITQDRGAGLVPALDDLIAPLDDDYDAIRRQMWLITDAVYKRAVSVFAKKKATFQNRAVGEIVPDFSREQPVETLQPVGRPALPPRDWVARARELSAVIGQTPGLDRAEVWISATYGSRYFLNSEGFKTVQPVGSAYLGLFADLTADDGSTVRDMFTVVERRLDDLPGVEELSSLAREVAARARARQAAPVGDEFTGPVLVEGQASAEIVRQALAPLFAARRPADAENERLAQGQGEVTPFLRRIGLRVLSEPFSIADTPSLQQFEGRPVAGSYIVDDEGVPARDVTLVTNGRLRTLLTGRTPQRNLPQSNGHGRAGGVQPGVLQIESGEAIPAARLKSRYLELLKEQELPFGYIVRSIAPPGEVPGIQGGGPLIVDLVKVTPDGREEGVRGLRFADVPSTVFRDILEASRERLLYSYRLNVVTAASVIVPSMIFEELEIQRTREIVQKPPVVPAPLVP